MHTSQCERLLQSNSSTVERARLVKQILTFPAALKCKPMQEQCTTAAADGVNLSVSLTMSPWPIKPQSVCPPSPAVAHLVASDEITLTSYDFYLICVSNNMIAYRKTIINMTSEIYIYDFSMKK